MSAEHKPHSRDYLERTIETVRNHRDAENCWPSWANVFADEIERLWSLEEQKEAADRVLAVADQLAEWCRVTTSVEGVFSNNLGAQAQGQGMANLVVRYAATRESYPASEPEASA